MAKATFSGNLDLSSLHKKKFTIDGDSKRVLELDTSDLAILHRLTEASPRIDAIIDEMFTVMGAKTEDGDSEVKRLGSAIHEMDVKLRAEIDFIFNSNVSEVCAPTGSMFDPCGGSMRYERIIEAIMPLYESSLGDEMKRISERIQSHTSKYTDNQ